MTQTVNRLFADHDNATRAADILRGNRIWDGHVYVVGGMRDRPDDEITAAVMKSLIARAEARLFAKAIRDGATLVTVHAPFGHALGAMHVLDGFGPIESEVAAPPRKYREWNEGAPLSSTFGLATLMRDPAPMSAFFGLQPLTSGASSLSEAVGLPELVDSKEAFSDMIGVPMLSRHATPLSSLLRIPLLWRR